MKLKTKTNIKTKNPNPSIKRIDGIPHVMFYLPKPIIASTDGSGLWSNSAEKTTTITKIGIRQYPNDVLEAEEMDIVDECWMYACVFFDNKDWSTSRNGLIYTDEKWIKQFNSQLKKLYPNFLGKFRFDYTEQGMQGNNYVSIETSTIRGKKKCQEVTQMLASVRLGTALDSVNVKHSKALKKLASK